MADLKSFYERIYGPTWPWDLAFEPPSLDRRAHGRRINHPYHDRACRFVDIWRAEGREAAERSDPTIAAAERLQADFEQVRKLKILVLGGWDDGEISELLGLDLVTVGAWAALFFDARDALGSSWIYHRVIMPELTSGDAQFARKMKLAWAGGKGAALAILDLAAVEAAKAAERLPYTAADMLIQRILRCELALDAALDRAERSSHGDEKFLLQYGAHRLEERRIELAKRRLEERCSAAAHKRKIEQLRLEAQVAGEKRRSETEKRAAAEALAKAERGASRKRTATFPTDLPIVPRIHDEGREPPMTARA